MNFCPSSCKKGLDPLLVANSPSRNDELPRITELSLAFCIDDYMDSLECHINARISVDTTIAELGQM